MPPAGGAPPAPPPPLALRLLPPLPPPLLLLLLPAVAEEAADLAEARSRADSTNARKTPPCDPDVAAASAAASSATAAATRLGALPPRVGRPVWWRLLLPPLLPCPDVAPAPLSTRADDDAASLSSAACRPSASALSRCVSAAVWAANARTYAAVWRTKSALMERCSDVEPSTEPTDAISLTPWLSRVGTTPMRGAAGGA